MIDDEIRGEAAQRPGAQRDARLDWWRAARFGLFIHWGLYAIPAGVWNGQPVAGIGEWLMHRARVPVRDYERLASQFNPAAFDADAWAQLAQRAGQRYLVITAKHHDGFCMFETALTPYNIVAATPFKRDPMRELAEACARHDVRLCFYYSQTQDWHHPGGDGNDWDHANPDFDRYVEEYVKPQVRELLTNYGPIGLIWFDTPRRMSPHQSQDLVDLVHQLQPACLVNGRIGNALGDYAEARDNVIPSASLDMDWETPATINDTWGFKSFDENWKSSDTLIRKLADCASKNGNYLLNVGPTATGTIPEASVARLEAVGGWLARNGSAIYGTRAGPLQGRDWCRSTVSANARTVYVHVFEWPADGIIRLPSLQVTHAELLAEGQSLPLRRKGEGLEIQGPRTPPDGADTVIALR